MIDSIKRDSESCKLRQAFFDYYHSEIKERTVEAYLNAFDHWEHFTGDPDNPEEFPPDPDIHQITNLTLSKFKSRFLRQYSPATFNKVRAHLLAVLNRLGPKQKHNPAGLEILPDFVFVPRAKELEKPPRVASDAEIDAIYQAAANATWPKFEFGPGAWWQALIVFLFNTGLRRNDFLALRTQDVDLENQCFEFRAEKTGKFRRLPLHASAVEHFRRIWSDREFVFPKPSGKRSLYQHWHKIQDAAGIETAKHFTFHQLRSTCGSRLFSVSPGAAQEMLGHSSINTTRKSYANLTEHLRDVTIQTPQPFTSGKPGPRPDDDPDPHILRFPA